MVGASPERRRAVASVPSKVLDGVAEHEEVEPLEPRPPLDDVIDPDASEAPFADSKYGEYREENPDRFRYRGYDVAVDGNGEIDVSNVERAIS